MKKYIKVFQFLLPILAVLIIEILLFKSNFLPGTWLTGWDSTQPELNIKEHLIRNLGAVWQEYRGLGVLDGMAHSVNIVHTFYIWILSLFMQANLVRYFFVFLMHGLGGLGVYFLVRFLFKTKGEPAKSLSATLASAFYLFNPASIQMFYAPLELFIVHFGFLPWLVLALLNYLETGRKKDLLILFVVNLAAVSQAHVPTIFIVYALLVGALLLFNLLRNFKNNLKKSLLALVVVFLVNAFWGLPYIYSAYKNAQVITSSKINQLSNPEIVLRNEAFGDFKSTALLKGFSLDYEDWKGESEFGYQMESWRAWWSQKPVEIFGLILFGIASVGVVSVILTRKKAIYPFATIFAISFINLGARVPIISFVRSLFWNYVPYYEEVFRFAYTKFAIVYALSLAILLAYSLVTVFSVKILKLFSFVLALILIAGIAWGNMPAFKGEFLYDRLKLEIPQEYFDVFEFFNKDEHGGRVAILPQPSFWGWEYDRWGYRGSGIIWQGISSPILHRSFDPWSKENESYYLEITDAIYRKDIESISKVLSKYQISWIVLDANIFQPGGWPEALYFEEINDLLKSNDGFKLIGSYGDITVYQTNFVGSNNFVHEISGNYSLVSDDFSYLRRDPNLPEGSYVTANGISHPFASLLEDRPTIARVENGSIFWDIDIKADSEILTLPTWAEKEDLVPVDLYATYDASGKIKFRILGLFPKIKVDGKAVTEESEGEFNIALSQTSAKLYLSFGDNNYYQIERKEGEQYIGSLLLPFSQNIPLKIYRIPDDVYFDLYTNFEGEKLRKCWQREGKETKADVGVNGDEIRLNSTDATACLGARLPMNFTGPQLLSISLEHMSLTDTPPDTCLSKEGSSGCIGVSPFYQSGSNKNWGSVTTFYETQEGGIYWLDLLSRAQDEVGAEASISYKNVLTKTYPLSAQTSVRLEESFAPKERIVDVKGAKKISLELPLGQDLGLVKKEVWTDNRGGLSAENCSIFGLGEVEKIVESTGISYKASNKSINCDHFVYSGFRENQGYLLRLKGENKEGRSLKYILSNHSTRHSDLEDLLPKGKFDATYTLLPGTNLKGEYTLVVETRSFGSETSTNFLEGIEFLPIPINWMIDLSLKPENYHDLTSSIKVNNTSKKGTFFYKVETQGEGVIALSQAYEEGWIAISLSNSKFQITNYKLLPHFKLNGWENGWIIENSKIQIPNSKFSNHESRITNPQTILIVYWPQYIGFLGLGLLMAGLGFILLHKDQGIDKEKSRQYNYPA